MVTEYPEQPRSRRQLSPGGKPKSQYADLARTADLYNEIAEQELLAACMADAKNIYKIKGPLSPDSFYFAANKIIYEAMQEISLANPYVAISLPTIIERLNAKGMWGIALGKRNLDEAFLRDIDRLGTKSVVDNLDANVTIIRRYAEIRRTRANSEEFITQIQANPEMYETLREEYKRKLYELDQAAVGRRDARVGAILAAREGKIPARPTPSGIVWFDEAVSFRPGFIFCLNAPLKQRKTSFARYLMLEAVLRGAPVLWFTTDGDREIATDAWLVLLATKWMWEQKNPQIPQSDWRLTTLNLQNIKPKGVEIEALAWARKRLTESNLMIYDNVDNIEGIRATESIMRQMRVNFQGEKELYVVYDFLQNMHPDEYSSQMGWMSSPLIQGTRMMRNFITANGATGILLNQMSVESIKDRESGKLSGATSGIKGGNYPAEVADFNLMTWYNKLDSPTKIKVEFGLNRYGAEGEAVFNIHPKSGLILNPNYPFDINPELESADSFVMQEDFSQGWEELIP